MAEPTNAEKTHALPWALAGDAANITYVSLVFAGPVFLLFLDQLGMDKKRIGLILGVIQFASVATMWLAPWIARIGHKRAFMTAYLVRKVVMSLLIATPWVLHRWGADAAFTFVATVVAVFSLSRSIGMLAFSPWVQQFVPGTVRGRFSAAQNMVWVVMSATAVAGAGWFLGDSPPLGRFRILFIVGLAMGLFSIILYQRVPGGGPVYGDKRQRYDLWSLWEALCDRNLLRFLIAGALLTLGWAPLSMGGFLPLFLKEQLGLRPDQVLYFNAALLGSGLLSCFVWGWAADRYGSKPVLLLAMIILCMNPLGLWLLPRDSAYTYQAVLLLAVIVGLALPGYQVSYTRWLYVKLIPSHRRTPYTALHLGWTGLMSGLAPLLAGYALEHTAELDSSIGFATIDPYTPLMWSGMALMLLSLLVVSRMAGDTDVPVSRFAGMFVQGNAVAAMQALVLYQRGGVEERRVSTIEKLGHSRSPLNVEELVEGLRDPGFNVRFEAIVSIARTRSDPKLTAALIAVLRGGEPDMCIAAAWALGRVGDARAIEPLREALCSNYPLLRARSARALGTLGDQASHQIMLARLEAEPEPGLKLAYASALGALRSQPALDQMLELLDELDNDPQRLELALAVASVIGRDDWFVLLARRVGKAPGDALGGVLLSMRRYLLRALSGDSADAGDQFDRCIKAFGSHDLARGVDHLRRIGANVPTAPLTDGAQRVLAHALDQMQRSGADRLDCVLLCLHVFHTHYGVGATNRAREDSQ